MRGHHVAYTLAFLPARHRLARASLNAHCGAGSFAWRAADGELYGRSIALLRPCRERPCGRRAAEQRDELAAVHSITSSARASTVTGTSMPSALAVLRLITSSYLVGACTGRSVGFSPLSTRST